MSNSKAKRKYNKANYRRYEFSVRLDSKLEYLLSLYVSMPGNSLSNLVKSLLSQHFGVSPDDIWVPVRFNRANGECTSEPNNELDEIINRFNLDRHY